MPDLALVSLIQAVTTLHESVFEKLFGNVTNNEWNGIAPGSVHGTIQITVLNYQIPK